MKVYQILLRKGMYNGVLFGIEIEVEGDDLPHSGNKNLFGVWNTVPDGSLRNGVEYVSVKPLTREKTIEAISSLNKVFTEEGSLLSFSSRTSVHVHVNVLDMELQHLANIIYLYYVLEDVFLNYAGPLRKENRFCLSGKNADGIYVSIINMLSKKNLALINNNTVKYAALNIGAITKHGSLEFRALRGTSDTTVIDNWLIAIEGLVNTAKVFKNPLEIFNRLNSEDGVDYFINSVFKNKECFSYNGMHNDIMYAISLSSCLVGPLSYKEEENDFVPL